MTYFSKGGVCAPTAATNLMYYYVVNYSKYKKLYTKLGTYKKVFNKLFDLMDTDLVDGTSQGKVVSAYKSYFSYCGLSCTATLKIGTNKGKSIAQEIGTGLK